MTMKIGTKRVQWLGDVHLGKRFINGVPLHRRGEREVMVIDDFQKSLLNTDADVHVMMGDLFDKFVVPPEVVLLASETYRAAATKNSRTDFVVMRGNHDASRDTDRASSFDLFAKLVEPLANVYVTLNEPMLLDNLLFMPWHPFISAAEMFANVSGKRCPDAVFGHWDKEVFGGEEHNLIPTKEIAKYTKLAISGHDHTPDEFIRDGVRCIYTGSMQPYTHKEDPKSSMYMTLSLVQLNQIVPALIKDKCIRVLLADGEKMPDTEFDCLQLSVMKVGSEQSEKIDVQYEAFDFDKLWTEAMTENGVLPEMMERVRDQYRSIAAD